MSASVHGSAVLVRESGVLIRGPSGAGKSLLALEIIERVTESKNFAALVADDRVWLEPAHGRIIARGAPALAGLCERRGVGLVETPYESAGVIRLVVDIAGRGKTPPRMPEPADKYASLCGVALPRLALDLSPGLASGVTAVLSALKRLDGYTWRKNNLDETVFA
jgi:serine kinase of HPr protein (carbohydrate metabolism regulator)